MCIRDSFLPTMKTLGELHKIGIFHYGLSPETIYVTAKNQMKISGFSIPDLHNRQSVINTELFKGYAAPEQYEIPMDSCGAWTDVYSLAATIYKTLTGTMPPDSKTRTGNDNLLPPDSLNASVPKSVSIALMSALTISPKLRTQTMSELKGDITSAPRGTKPSQFQLDIPEEKRELKMCIRDRVWAIPYLVKVCDEYVVEILQTVYEGLMGREDGRILQFCAENPVQLQRSYARMTSYWNEFYRGAYPNFRDYVGRKLFLHFFGMSRCGRVRFQRS